MRLGRKVRKFLADNPKARKVLKYLKADGSNVLGSWYMWQTTKKDKEELIQMVGTMQEGENGEWQDYPKYTPARPNGKTYDYQVVYHGEQATEVFNVLRALEDLKLVDVFVGGGCSDPILYALRGEWKKKGWIRKKITGVFEPRPPYRKLVLETIESIEGKSLEYRANPIRIPT